MSTFRHTSSVTARELPFSLWITLSVLMAGKAVLAADVPETIANAMSGTPITSTQPTVIDGLYEVVAGDNLLYVDRTGRYLVVGSIYDLKEDRDLSAERRAAIHLQRTTAPRGAAEVGSVRPAEVGDRPIPRQGLAELLSSDGVAITTGQGRKSLTVITDPSCGWCRRLWMESLNELEDVQVNHLLLHRTEQAIGILCANDPAKELGRAFAVSGTTAKTPVPSSRCRRIAAANIERVVRFAKSVGWLGTPVLIREDGAIHTGYLGRSDLLNWLGGKSDES